MIEDFLLRRNDDETMASLPENPVPAMAYVPFQQFGETFEVLKAFDSGTLFPVLNKPFLGKRGDSK